MAAQIGSLFFELGVSTAGLVSGVNRGARATEAGMARITRSAGLAEAAVLRAQRPLVRPLRPFSLIAASRAFDTTNSRAQLLRGSVIAMTGAFGGFAAALAGNVVLRYADSYTELQNQIRVVSRSQAALTAQFEAVASVSERARAGLRETAILYSRLRKAAPDIEAQKILEFTSTIQKSLQLGGATAQEAASAAIQFSQAIASNRLGGEELRAVLETPLGLELARGMNVTIGRFRELSKQGKLTADVLFKSLEASGPRVAEQFDQSIRTFDQAITIADNQLTKYIGRLNESVIGTTILGNAVLGITGNLESLAPILGTVVGLLGSGFAGRALSSPLQRAGGAIQTLRNNATKELKAATAAQAAARTADFKARNELAKLKRAQANATSIDFADASLVSASQRASAQANQRLPQLDRRVLRLKEEQVRLTRELGRITTDLSPRQIQLSEQIATSQRAINTEVAREARARLRVRQAVTAQTAALGLQATTGGGTSRVTRATREHTKAVRELGSAQAAVAKARETLSARTIRLTEAETAATQRAIAARANALAQIDANVRTLARVDRRRDELVGSSREARTAAQQSSRANVRQGITTGTAVIGRTGTRLETAVNQLTAAQRAARPLGLAIRGVTSAFFGLIGLLGGPWGAAITAGIAGFTFLSISSAETAAAVERNNRRIAATLQALRAARGLTGERAEELLGRREILAGIEQSKKDIEDGATAFEQSFDRITNIVLDSIRKARGRTQKDLQDGLGFPSAEDLQPSQFALKETEAAIRRFATSEQDIGAFIETVQAIPGLRYLSNDQKTELESLLIQLGAVAIDAETARKSLEEFKRASKVGLGDVGTTTGDSSAVDAIRAIQKTSTTASPFAQSLRQATDTIDRAFTKESVARNKGALEIQKIEAATRAVLKDTTTSIRQATQEQASILSDISQFRRSFVDQVAGEANVAGQILDQANAVAELELKLQTARTALEGTSELFSLDRLFGGTVGREEAGPLRNIVSDLQALGDKLILGEIQGRAFADGVLEAREELLRMTNNKNGVDDLINTFSNLVRKVIQYGNELRKARSIQLSVNQGNFLQRGGLSAETVKVGTGSSESRVIITRPTPRQIGEGVAGAGIRAGLDDIRNEAGSIFDVGRQNVSASDGIRAAVDSQTSQLSGDLRTVGSQISTAAARGARGGGGGGGGGGSLTPGLDRQLGESRFGSAADQLGTIRIGVTDPIKKAVEAALQKLTLEADVINTALQFKQLTDQQISDGQRRLAEISLQQAQIQQNFESLPPFRTRNIRNLDGSLSVRGTRGVSFGGGGSSADLGELLKDAGGGGGGLSFNTGGTFDVRGGGGIDSVPVFSMQTRGETNVVLKNNEHRQLLDGIANLTGGGGGVVIESLSVNVNGVTDIAGFEASRETIADDMATEIEQASALRQRGR